LKIKYLITFFYFLFILNLKIENFIQISKIIYNSNILIELKIYL